MTVSHRTRPGAGRRRCAVSPGRSEGGARYCARMAEPIAPEDAPGEQPAPFIDRDALDRFAAAERFSGVVRIDRGGQVELAAAYGMAHRGWDIPNTIDTRFALASG